MEFYKINLKSFFILFPWVLVSSIAVTLLILGTISSEAIYYVLFGIIFLFLMALYAMCFVTKIKFTKDCVEYNDPDRKVSIAWENVRSIGVYKVYNGYISGVNPEDFDKFTLWGQKFIFLSTHHNFFPRSGQKVDDSYIHFHWRNDAWEELQKHLLR